MKKRIGESSGQKYWNLFVPFSFVFYFEGVIVYLVVEFCSKVPEAIKYGTLFSFELYICTVARVDYMGLVVCSTP